MERLQIRVQDEEDVKVLSACMQDALVPLQDMAWLHEEGRFVMVASRFRWEICEPEPCEKDRLERVHCGLSFEGVTRVRMRGINRRADAGRIFELLAIRAAQDAVHLVFAGDAEIRLDVTRIDCHAGDVGEPWPAVARPVHPLLPGEG